MGKRGGKARRKTARRRGVGQIYINQKKVTGHLKKAYKESKKAWTIWFEKVRDENTPWLVKKILGVVPWKWLAGKYSFTVKDVTYSNNPNEIIYHRKMEIYRGKTLVAKNYGES